MPLTKVERRALPCRLTSEEIAIKSAVLLSHLKEADEITAEANLAKSHYKEKLESVTGQITFCKSTLIAKQEHRTVDCYWEMDYPSRTKRLVRSDLGEVVDTQPMTVGDMQLDLAAVDARPRKSETDGQSDETH